jgi:3-methyladenine DNA glycosylase Tag
MDRLPTFRSILERAINRVGEHELEERFPEVKSDDELCQLPDDRYLAGMARAAFSAGFKYWIVDAMWDGFEEAFDGFNPETVSNFGHEDIMRLGEDERIVRNKTKIFATVENARMIRDVRQEHPSFGDFVAGWGLNETVQLWEYLGEHGHHLGGNSGARSLRYAGRDTFILTRDVTYALREHYNIMSYSRHSKSGRREAQDAMLKWREESERPLSHVSMALACSLETPDGYSPR